MKTIAGISTSSRHGVIAERRSNVLIPWAKAKAGGPVGSSTKFWSKIWGGLWVGGKTYLTAEAIMFEPNRINAALHEGTVSMYIPMRDVTYVKLNAGLFGKVIEVGSPRHTMKIRCPGARQFAEMIENVR